MQFLIESVGGADWSYFSALCWMFGRRLYEQYGIPIGLISSNYGGTRVEAWSSPETISRCNSRYKRIYWNFLLEVFFWIMFWYSLNCTFIFNKIQSKCAFILAMNDPCWIEDSRFILNAFLILLYRIWLNIIRMWGVLPSTTLNVSYRSYCIQLCLFKSFYKNLKTSTTHIIL